MATYLVLHFLFVGAVLLLSKVTNSSTSTLHYGAKFANFTHIGTVDGKTYLAEQTATSNWTQSMSFCNASGMRLATITSLQQRRTLDNAPWTILDSYWIGGRDSQITSQFSWDYNEETLNANYSLVQGYGGIQTCVYYHSPAKYLGSYSCSYNRMRPLCEFIHGK